MSGKSNNGDPSVPDLGSMPANYNEPSSPPPDDRLPPGDAAEPPTSSPVGLRIRVEDLLGRREAPSDQEWRELGPDARELLVVLIDDPVIAEHEAMRQRVVATTAQLGLTQALPRLGEMLLDESESALTRTYAANAIGRIRPDDVVEALGRAISDEDAMVRRQVARALGKAQDPAVVPYLERLSSDPSVAVAEAAVEQLRARGFDVGPEPTPDDRPYNVQPAPEFIE